jgi:hypothetical protein
MTWNVDKVRYSKKWSWPNEGTTRLNMKLTANCIGYVRKKNI